MNPVSVLDYRYGTEQMRDIFRADSYLGFLMEVEAALAEVQESIGLIPKNSSNEIRNAISKVTRKATLSWVPGKYVSLGTDGFGRSDTRENLRKFFEMDADHIAAAAISTLLSEEKLSKSKAEKVLKTLDVNPDADDPARN